MGKPSTFRIALLAAAAVIAASVIVVFVDYRRDISLARERVATGSLVTQTPCGPIEYATLGQGKPVLIVHGAGGGYDQALDFSALLAANGMRGITMSRFGYLRTPLPTDASAAAQSDAHACLLDALGIGKASIIGVSAGAPSSIQFALRHPQRCSALVLLVPAAYAPRPADAAPVATPRGTALLFDSALKSDFLFWLMTKAARRTLIRAILATPPALVDSASAGERSRVQKLLEHILPVSSRRTGLLNDAAVVNSIGRYPLERVSAPTLVMSTADDLFGTFDIARYTAAQIPGARLVTYPDGGHLWVGHQDEVSAEIISFLQ